MTQRATFRRSVSCTLFGLVALGLGSAARPGAQAAEEPSFAIEFNDGVMTPLRLEVPANTRFKIALTNKGKTPAEFESNELRLEKVLAAGSTSTLVIRTLDPGEYKFFDDFHPDAPQAVLVAK